MVGMNPITCRSDLPSEHVHPYWTGRAEREGLVRRDVAVELLAELPKGPTWGDPPDLDKLLDKQMESGCWNIAFPLMVGGHIDQELYYSALRLRLERGLAA